MPSSTAPRTSERPSAIAPAPAPIDLAASTPALPSLTGLRWIAAAAVFVYHVRNQRYFHGDPQAVLSAIAGPGFTGVSLFFLLSGFVLAWSARPGLRASGFYRRRIARVLPLHLVALAIALVLAATLLPSLADDGPAPVIANALLVSSWVPDWWQAGNPVSWSLVCEAFFYACFPLLFAAASRLGPRGLRALLVGAAALAAVAAVLATAVPHLGHAGFLPPVRLPEFVAGIALALLVRRGLVRGPHPLVATALVAVGWIAASLWVPTNGPAMVACTLVGYLALLASLATADVRGIPTPLGRPMLVRLGELSFAFYLVHLLVIQAMKALAIIGHAPYPVPFTAAAFATALLLAWVLHRVVERPARNLLLRPAPCRRSA